MFHVMEWAIFLCNLMWAFHCEMVALILYDVHIMGYEKD